MISAIKMKSRTLESGNDFDAILDDDDGPAMVREEEFKEMQSPFFEALDDLWWNKNKRKMTKIKLQIQSNLLYFKTL